MDPSLPRVSIWVSPLLKNNDNNKLRFFLEAKGIQSKSRKVVTGSSCFPVTATEMSPDS